MEVHQVQAAEEVVVMHHGNKVVQVRREVEEDHVKNDKSIHILTKLFTSSVKSVIFVRHI